MPKPNVETFLGCDAPWEAAGLVLFGAPFDSTVSFRPGARFGSGAMRRESAGLETYSPYQDRDLADCAVCDLGDLELRFGCPEAALGDIEACAAEILQAGKLPLLLGGEHLVTLGAVRAAARVHTELCVLHFDAHADLRDDYLGAKLSHACVLRRCHDLLGDGRIFQFCIRSGDWAEFRFAAAGRTHLEKFGFSSLSRTLAGLGNRPVYLTVDLDVLDPSVLPGTGTPEAGGLSFLQLLEALRAVCAAANVVGADVCELAPALDPSGASTAAACKLVRELILALQH